MAQAPLKTAYRRSSGRSSPIQEDVPPFPRARKNSNASMVSEDSPASLRRQRQNMHSFEGSSSNLSLPLLFIKEKLQWTVFSAEYRERRHLDFLKSYRDVLVIDDVEKNAIKTFKEVIKHCKKEMDEDVWIGIKKHADTVSLFVELAEGTPFGHYWFLVRSVKYRSSDGLEMRIRCLREVCSSDGPTPDPAAPGGGRPLTEWSRDDLVRWMTARVTALPWGEAAAFCRQIFSVAMVREVFRFITVLLLLLVNCFKDVHLWLLRAVDTAGVFVQRCTPLATALLQFCLKIVGGFYILLARVWVDMRHGSPPPPPPPPGMPSAQPQRALMYQGGARGTPGSGPYWQGSPGPGMGPRGTPGMGPGMGRAMGPGMGPGMGYGARPSMSPGVSPSMSPSMGSGMSSDSPRSETETSDMG
ncbi:hypothetical protein FJT64_015811 [Amphibalanus amphitrite]|uniref:Uncharacterized protein n=1 Tax=Amphibalanus amphitrite TaxID=1232801 RepID=A0A6A4X1X3_AMPAM|nr:hypothetical protein FJT64_015811 [Amphibalanus amphitrite]KAF0313676.1 hypothetical protein FJT64_015811 [Amphibalanus amphitrite]